jgi:hypothetical protein
MQPEIHQAVAETDISSISEVGLGVLRIELRNQRAIKVARPLIEPKALPYAHDQALPFEVGRSNEAACATVGHTHDEWASPASLRAY